MEKPNAPNFAKDVKLTITSGLLIAQEFIIDQ